MSICAVSTLSVLTETPGIVAPMQANILPPTFQASWPPPQGSDTSAPGNARQIALTISRLIETRYPENAWSCFSGTRHFAMRNNLSHQPCAGPMAKSDAGQAL